MPHLDCYDASKHLIDTLRPDESISLDRLMREADDRGIRINNVMGDDHRLGDYMFELAHLIIVSYHVDQGEVEADPEDEEQRIIWDKYREGELFKVESQDDDAREQEFLARLYRVPFRLTALGAERKRTEQIVYLQDTTL